VYILRVEKITPETQQVYLNLVQAYEAEFSKITEKQPNAEGLFELDTPLDDCHCGYIPYMENTPIGLANIALKPDNNFEVCEFYILPLYRKQNYGTHFAAKLWQMHTGHWEIKQIEGAEYATTFWRKALKTAGITFEETAYLDAYWGYVTRQEFYNG